MTGWRFPTTWHMGTWSHPNLLFNKMTIQPIGSMYGILTYIWLICMVNVGKYTIHGWSGQCQMKKTLFSNHHLLYARVMISPTQTMHLEQIIQHDHIFEYFASFDAPKILGKLTTPWHTPDPATKCFVKEAFSGGVCGFKHRSSQGIWKTRVKQNHLLKDLIMLMLKHDQTNFQCVKNMLSKPFGFPHT